MDCFLPLPANPQQYDIVCCCLYVGSHAYSPYLCVLRRCLRAHYLCDMRSDAVVVHTASLVLAAMLSVHALHLSVLAVMLLSRAQRPSVRAVLL